MKRLLFFSILSIFCLAVSAQTKTWIGPSGGNFSLAANWNPAGVPTSTNDVIIPTGSNVIMNGANIKSFAIQGNSEVTMTNTVYFTHTSSIAANASFIWSTGYLEGTGTLNNNGSFTVIGNINKYIQGPTTTINNAGTINFPVVFYLFVGDASIINNLATGVIDFKSDANIAPGGTAGHILNNAGLIKKSDGTGTSTIALGLNNTGTISVQSGTLNLDSEDKTFDGGVYNVANGSILRLGTNINMNGTLTGQLDGAMNWINYVTVATTATLDFTGNGFTWYSSYLSGDGVLINNGIFNFSTNANRYIYGSTTLENQGTIIFSVGCDLRTEDNSTLYNAPGGIIDFQADAIIDYGAAGSHIFNNAGLIKKTSGITSSISAKMINTGTISVETGTLDLSYQEKTLDGGIYNVNSGSVLRLSSGSIHMSGTLTGQLDGEMKCGSYGGNVTVANTATLDFNGSGFNWDNGHLAGDGILTNNGVFNFSSNANRYIDGATTLNNLGTINFTVGCDLRTEANSTFYNAPSGIIDFQADAIIDFGSAGSHIFNNAGLVKKTAGTTSTISAKMINTGTISVETGTLDLSYQEKTLDGGVYNVNSGSVLRLAAGNINLNGTLTGQLDGEMKCGSYGNNVTVANAATLDFNGSGFSWDNGHLIGDGVLTNNGIFNFSSNANRYMEGTTILANQGTINFTVGCSLFVSDDTVIDNKASGIIDFQIEASIGSDQNGVINNAGLIEKTGGTGVAYINLSTNNSGIIDLMSGELEFMNGNVFTNMVGGKVMGTATIDVPAAANFTNNGIFAPGASPGTLTVVGDYNSSSTSELEIELDGNNQGIDYDLLAVQGNAIMDGNIDVHLGFVANVNDEFVILTANNITSCNLPATVTASYDFMLHTFDVICNPTNVTLKVTNIVLGTEENSLSNLSMYPNPSNGNFTIDLGNEYTDVTVQITNMLGQLISSEKYASAKIIENEITGAAGIYFVKVSTAKEGSNTLRVIKQ